MAKGGKEFFKEKYATLGGRIAEVQLRQSLRVNTLRTTQKELIPRLEELGVKLTRLDGTKNGYGVQSKFSLGAITEHLLGYYYLQETASQMPAEALDPKPGEIVLDCCAAPGGKTTQMAALMKNKGTIIAYELKKHRIPSLMMNLERCWVKNTTAFQGNFSQAKSFGTRFDKILLDVPCSGNYTMEQGWFEKRTQEDIQQNSERQKTLLREAIGMLKQNGVLVYSTCSLEPEENELNINWAIENLLIRMQNTGLKAGEPGIIGMQGKKLNEEVKLCRRFWPEKTETQGFFIAKMVKL